ncbi:MAG: tetratricopeptide repeat protein [Dehalococcoidales bacterium]|nr:tetratricopeptide repeat protein [Dehalococcoidales bacterium]
MQAEDIAMYFDDAPNIEQLETAISGWQRPAEQRRLADIASAFNTEGRRVIRQRLIKIKSNRHRSQLEVNLISWLYDFIRANIKRGKIFDLHEVLRQGSADCLGYAKLFTLLGRLIGLDAGIVEIVIDNKGRYAPHTVIMVKLKDHRSRFIDLWYGSKNIKHQRVGLQVKRGKAWKIEDVDLSELSGLDIRYLPDSCVNAITLYIRGNQHLNRADFDSAIKCYSKALELYPGNARFFYNRAVAYEKTGEYAKAAADYARALRNEAAITRVLAREHDEVTALIKLDTSKVDNLAQEIYLRHTGFTTGKEVPLTNIARKFGLTEIEAAEILSATETRIST